MRIYVSMSGIEAQALEQAAKREGLSLPLYIKQKALAGLEVQPYDIKALVEMLLAALQKCKKDELFTCASLMGDAWFLMTSSQKSSVAQILKKEVEKQPGSFETIRLSNKTNRYRKIK